MELTRCCTDPYAIYISFTKYSCHNNTLTLTLSLPRPCRVGALIAPTDIPNTGGRQPDTPVLNDGVSKDTCTIKPPDAEAPSSTSIRAHKAETVDEVTADTSDIDNDASFDSCYEDNDSDYPDQPPSISSYTEKEGTNSSYSPSPSPSPMANSQAKNACIADGVIVNASVMNSCDSDDSAGSEKPPSLSSLTEKEATGSPALSSLSPSSTAKSHAKKAYSIAKEDIVVDEASDGSKNDDDDECSSPNSPPPSYSCSSDEGSATLPPTQSLSTSLASSSSTEDSPPPSVESPPPPSTPPLAQLPPPSLVSSMNYSPPTSRTSSVNSLGGMFSPPVDKPTVNKVIQDVFCSKRS